jgi:Holliday junction resolvasome RuvABC DNA-binding subunit
LEEGRIESPLDEEIIGALLNLGYSAAESRRAASSVPSNVKTLEERLRGALRYLGA